MEPTTDCCPVIELRQYTLKPGQRDTLLELFEREFLESQEAVGMPILGQFRDLDRPERFVWLRGFPDLASRKRSLEAFYGGPVWKAHRQAANETMLDSSNALLLKPARPTSGFRVPLPERPPVGATTLPSSVVVATVYTLETPVDETFVAFFEQALRPALEAAGLPVWAYFQTEPHPNTFPALPVREGEHVFVWFSSAPAEAVLQERLSRVKSTPTWKGQLEPTLNSRLKREPEVLRLAPGARSRLRG